MNTERLSSLEAAFLALDSRDAPFVFACILQFDRAIPVEALRTQIATALVEAPRLSQRIARRIGGPIWVDDLGFRIDRHVRAITAGPPGASEQLEQLAAKLIVGELPHAHPPWRLWTVDGLAGDRGAVIAVIHHAVLDGIAGIRLLEHIVGTRQSVRTGAQTQPRAQIRRLASRANLNSLGKLLRDGLRPASQIGLNPRHTSRDRAITAFTVDLESVHQIEKALGVTNNDVVLAIAAGALRRLLAARGVDVDAAHDVRAMVPVSRHRGSPETLSGNRVALVLAPLPVDLPDPEACLHRISSATRRLKRENVASGGDLFIALSERAPLVLGAVLRIVLRLRGFNIVITNIPGPRTELAILGARLTGITPIVNLWPHHALGIAVASYAGTLTFGLHVDRNVIPNIAEVRDAVAASFAALLEVVRRTQPSTMHV